MQHNQPILSNIRLGLFFWLLTLLTTQLPVLPIVLLFAAFIIVPLGLTSLNGRLHPTHQKQIQALQLPAALLLIAATSITLSMSLALLYALGQFTNSPILFIPTMIRYHGLLNAFGFSLCGLLAFAIKQPSAKIVQLS